MPLFFSTRRRFIVALAISILAQAFFVLSVYLYVYPVYSYFAENDWGGDFGSFVNHHEYLGHELPGPVTSLAILLIFEFIVLFFVSRVVCRASGVNRIRKIIEIGVIAIINVVVLCLGLYYGCYLGDCLDIGFI